MRHDQITEEGQGLAALYALGALTQHEARAFESHIRDGCATCKEEIEKFESLVGTLGFSAESATPPVYLRDLLSARIEKEKLEQSDKASQSASVIPFPERAKTTSQPPATSRSSHGFRLLPWAVAASLLIALAYSIMSWQTERKNGQALLSETAVLRDKLNRESAREKELAQINAVLQSPQKSTIKLEGQEVSSSSSANIYWDIAEKRWVVTADLPPAPAGKVYQLWIITPDAQKLSVGLIEQDDKGHGFTVFEISPNVNDVAAAAITLEPKGGSQQPTMPIYAMGKAG
ncbi:MAG: anti-sigma factor [Blastocatellia bacterium]